MNEALFEEVEVLSSIYGEAAISISLIKDSGSTDCKPVTDSSTVSTSHELTYSDAEDHFKVIFDIPPNYPVADAPRVTISFDRSIETVSKQMITHALEKLVADRSVGEVILFPCIQLLKERIREAREKELATKMNSSYHVAAIDTEVDINSNGDVDDSSSDYDTTAAATSLATTTPTKPAVVVHVIHGPTSCEKKSVFQSHLAAVSSMEEVAAFRAAVFADKKVAAATHNIFAFRFCSCSCDGAEVLHHDYDDDGETAAGGRVAEMMRLMGVTGVAVIVTRWFGGTLLGPDRFKFICNSARQLLEAHGFAPKTANKRR